MKRKAFELALITAVIITLLASPAPSAAAGWWFSVFPNAYTQRLQQDRCAPEIRFRLIELLQGLRFEPADADRRLGILRELLDFFPVYDTNRR